MENRGLESGSAFCQVKVGEPALAFQASDPTRILLHSHGCFAVGKGRGYVLPTSHVDAESSVTGQSLANLEGVCLYSHGCSGTSPETHLFPILTERNPMLHIQSINMYSHRHELWEERETRPDSAPKASSDVNRPLRACVLSHFSHVRLCNPMDHSPPGSSVLRILQQEYWSGLTCPPPGDSL